MKASEKQGLCKKLVTVLKRRYDKPAPKNDRSVLELLLYAVSLENVSVETAEATLRELLERFHDYNELRVSSLSEIEPIFNGMDDPEHRALRVRCILQDIFEKNYAFDFEDLRKKTLETATREMESLRHLTDFVRGYTLQHALEAHILPLDERMRNAAVWLGLVPPDASPREAGDSLKPAVRKADAPLFCHLLRCLATDSAFIKTFSTAYKKPPADGFDPESAIDRLEELIRSAGKRSGRKTAGTKRKSSQSKSKTKRKKQKTQQKSAAGSRSRSKSSGRKTKSKTKTKAKKKKKTKRSNRSR